MAKNIFNIYFIYFKIDKFKSLFQIKEKNTVSFHLHGSFSIPDNKTTLIRVRHVV